MGLFTKERITFRKNAIRFVIGIVIWTTRVHMHCKRAITNRICALRGNILFLLRSPRWLTHIMHPMHMPMHGFSAHGNAHARITFRKSFAFNVMSSKSGLNYANHDPNASVFAFQNAFRKAWFERALCSQRVKSGKGHNILFLLRSPRWLTHAWLQRAFPNCTRTNHVPKELCVRMSSESSFLRGSRSKRPFFRVSKARFKSLIWKSFAFTKGKWSGFQNQERVRITFRNGFRNMIRSFVNRPNKV